MYPHVKFLIDGDWCDAAAGGTLPVVNPATNAQIGTVARATIADLDRALVAAERGFAVWRAMSAYDRAKLMRKAAELLRARVETIAAYLTLEQGKPLGEARIEIMTAADVIDWLAEEARRTYGRLVPARMASIRQMVIKEPVGPAAAFTPWNFPINQVVRKLASGLAAGCSIIVKAPEETPAAPAELIRCFVDAGVPAGVIGLVFGDPAEISGYLIPHKVIRKISFTGSTVVGKQLAALAGQHMKRATMELGGHAPAIVFDDADIALASKLLAGAKFRNAGQVCISPTRFMIQDRAYDGFVDAFLGHTKAIKVGDGMDPASMMGPLANGRRVAAMEALIADAVAKGAQVLTGGERIGNTGNFFAPTVLANVPLDARVMVEEPFGPLALVSRFSTFDDALAEANRLPYGLASYAYTGSGTTANKLAAGIEAGMLSVNHHGLGIPETPFGGVKESGYGSEGGTEAIESYLVTKFFSHADV